MKNLFDPATVTEAKARIARLQPTSEPVWGKMNAGQMLAHCSATMEMAVGERLLPRRPMGRLFGQWAKSLITDEAPIHRNMKTDKHIKITDQRNFEEERRRLHVLLDRFATGGPAQCTTHPHSFFGKLTPMEWAAFMHQHLDHHLRQFSV